MNKRLLLKSKIKEKIDKIDLFLDGVTMTSIVLVFVAAELLKQNLSHLVKNNRKKSNN